MLRNYKGWRTKKCES